MRLSADYQVVYSRRRTLAIIVSKGKVTVRAPTGYNIEYIQQLVLAKQPWIRQHLLRQQVQEPTQCWQQRAAILFQGKPLPVVFSRATKSEVYLENDKLFITVSERVTSANLAGWHNKLLSRWLFARASVEFSSRLSAWADAMAVNYRELKLGQWQRRWGYCDSYGVIGLNWRLMMAPKWVSDYVMVHELAHRLVMNHSPDFWQTVSQHVPDYHQAQAWLSHYHRQLVE